MDPTTSLSKDFADLSVGDHAPHQPTQVSPERDRLIDDEHRALDEQLLALFGGYQQNRVPKFWFGLLAYMTLGDERLVTLKPNEAEALLTSQPSIKKLLQEALEQGSFKKVRQLSVLWPEVRETAKGRLRPFYEDVELTSQALQSAWCDTYTGDNHKLLFDNINAIPRTEKPYSNQIAIVQSSGTGKSRMVHEQANLVFTIPFNLREVVDNQDLAYPLPDDAVRDYLVKTSDLVVRTNYLKFFGSVFNQIYAELARLEELGTQTRTPEDLATWWSTHLEGRRKELYEAAIAAIEANSETTADVEFAAAESAKTALRQLLQKLDDRVDSRRIKLVIYFDEAHPLTKVLVPNNIDQKTRYDILCSCLNQFLKFPIFCIFLSTNSSLAQFAAPQALAKSARIRRGLAVTHAPITETPFDCCERLMVRPGELNIEMISEIGFMAQFGRPLFWTLLRGAGAKASELHTGIIELARAKLVASRGIDSAFNNFSPAARLAILDVQLLLDFEPRREKVQLEEAGLVASHMRIAYSIPEHREYLRSGYPSEPLLAEAAAQQLWTWRQHNSYIAIETLTDFFDSGLLNHGELGELTGRQLLLDAYHRAVETERAEKMQNLPRHLRTEMPPNFSAGCRLITFIKMLFTEAHANLVLESAPDNRVGTPFKFKDIFKDAIICFTHFGRMADDTGVTSTVAWAAFIRHMAIMCRNMERAIDCILPVFLGGSQLCEHVMTGVLIQFKRRKSSGPVNSYSIDQAKFNFFPETFDECSHRSPQGVTPWGTVESEAPEPPTVFPGEHSRASHRPYVTLVMELGVQPTTPEEAKTATKYRPAPSSSKKPKKPPPRPRTPPGPPLVQGGPVPATPSKMYIPEAGKTHYPRQDHARYAVFAYGCSPTVYRGIDAAHKASYALLLKSRDFLSEHPRKDEKSLKAVRRMKPFWNGGVDCYHWIEPNDILHGHGPPPPDVEFGVGDQMY